MTTPPKTLDWASALMNAKPRVSVEKNVTGTDDMRVERVSGVEGRGG